MKFRILPLFFSFLISSVVHSDEQAFELVDLSQFNQFEQEQRVLQGNLTFSFLKGDYDKALYYLDLWQGQKRTKAELAEADLMGASIYLALGMEDKAYELYNSLIQAGVQASGTAWYFLAQRFFERGSYKQALICTDYALKGQLNSTPIERQYQQQALQIRASSLANLDRLADAEKQILAMQRKSIWQGYAQYNLIIAKIRNRQTANELEALIELAVFDLPDTPEAKALKDRILLVAAIDAMDRKRTDVANGYFKRIRLDGPYAEPALLHYGWNLFKADQYIEAVQPWMMLKDRHSQHSTEAIEALLAMSYAMEKLSAKNQAARAYEEVESSLMTAIETMSGIRDNEASIRFWLRDWQQQNALQDWGWGRHTLTDIQDDRIGSYIHPLLSQDDFSMGLERLYDLSAMKSDLEEQYQSLVLWQDTLVERRKILADMAAKETLVRLQQEQEDHIRQGLKLNSRYYQEERKTTGFATPEETLDLISLNRVVELILWVEKNQSASDTHYDLEPYKERWRRAYGLTAWDLAVQKPKRRYETKREYELFRDYMGWVQNKLEYARSSVSWSQKSWLGAEDRLLKSKENIETTLAELNQHVLNQENDLIASIQAYLDQQETQYLLYLAQSRLALARVYDDVVQLNTIDDMKGRQ